MSLMLQHVRAAARANRLANERLHVAIATLPAEAFHAPRAGFFPSLAKTLNHILVIDRYYLDSLLGQGPLARSGFYAFVPADDLASLRRRQREVDEELIVFCDRLDEAGLVQVVHIDRPDRVDRDLAHRVLAHLAMHQTHHRGQVHAMLSSAGVKPPQLDEFLMVSDAPFRVGDLAAAGWSEQDLLGVP
ncbi:damage-inducible protein DinB [Caenimonas sedimenti]|uniref:Damage-inducible protein DinB n=1 Tax=Caenimonas sedimenti TaxID=2596921 RepID=A0A562ZDW0_9BURK|nr:DinB family protein [Caenimonas sedimenti]TWO64922.1 damage-inducible protein DinB [Caenimonas sedimenti]